MGGFGPGFGWEGAGLVGALPDGGGGVGWKGQGPGEDREVPPVVRLRVIEVDSSRAPRVEAAVFGNGRAGELGKVSPTLTAPIHIDMRALYKSSKTGCCHHGRPRVGVPRLRLQGSRSGEEREVPPVICLRVIQA